MIDRFEQRKLTRAKLIEAALQLFSTSGYDHATVDDISQAAGYSKGAYYFHFSTKDDILLELLRIWTEGRNAVLASAESDGEAVWPRR
jgi:AcrR family transcriptional regulator